MRALVREEQPSHGVFGEEGGMSPGDGSNGSEYLWVLDPIDGTKSFITGAPAHARCFTLHPSCWAGSSVHRIGLPCPKTLSILCSELFLPQHLVICMSLISTSSDATHGEIAHLLTNALRW